MARSLATLTTLLLLAIAAPSQAQSCVAPPGRGAIDEYCETVPNATGDRGPADPNRPAVAIPDRTAAALERAGADGQALNRLLKQDPASRDARKAGGESLEVPPARSGQPIPREPESNPLDVVREAISSGPTTGPLFALILFGITVLVLGWAWVRYRRRPDDA